jgi:hypothetical protein
MNTHFIWRLCFLFLGLIPLIGCAQQKELQEFAAYDNLGNAYNFSELQIEQNAQQFELDLPCGSAGYFEVFAEIGSGFEDQTNPLHQQRLEVLCEVLNEWSEFIPSEGAAQIKLLLRAFNPTLTLVGLKHYGTSFYTVPTEVNLGLKYSINDTELWKTLNSGMDSYGFLTNSLPSTWGMPGSQYYHAFMSFDFSMVAYHYELNVLPQTGQVDFYSAVLSALHRMYGFASLESLGDESLLSADFKYFSRWDNLLRSGNNVKLITPNLPRPPDALFNDGLKL